MGSKRKKGFTLTPKSFGVTCRKQGGFTLIEAVIYAAILALIFVLVVAAILVMMKSFGNSRIVRNINNSAITALERMTREIRLADDIDVANSIFDVSPGKLTLNTIDPDTGANTTIEFSLTGTDIMIKEGALSAEAITSPKVEVSELIFRQITASTISKAIKIELEIEAGQKSGRFYNTAILRRSY